MFNSHQQAGAVDPKEQWRYMSWWWRLCFVFPRCHLVNLNMYPLTVYNHMDSVIIMFWLRSWPTMHPGNVFHSIWHNYIIAISKQDTVSLAGREAVFWGKVHWSLGLKGCFQAEMWSRVERDPHTQGAMRIRLLKVFGKMAKSRIMCHVLVSNSYFLGLTSSTT